MNSIPQNLASITPYLKPHLSALLLWFSQLVYDRLLARDPNHFLVQLSRLLDFTPLEQACAAYHHQTGAGKKPVHTAPKLLRAMLVKYLYDLSLRQLEEELRYNLLVKWFVGYAVFDEGPDHSTLQRFESYLALCHPRLFFDTVLKQIDAAFPHDRTCAQIGDTFAVHANAALESLIKRLRHTCQELLLAFQAAHPQAYDTLWPQLPRAALFGAPDEKIEYALCLAQRKQRLLATLNAARHCLSLVQAHPLPEPVQKWVARLQKIISDELRLTVATDGQVSDAQLLPAKERGTYAICSATDPEATIRNHGPGKADFGYNVSIAATTEFIREIQADTGSQPDPVAIPDLLTNQMAHHDLCPEKFIYDQAAGLGKYAAAVTAATDGHTQLVARPQPTIHDPHKFGPQDFRLSADQITLTCPHGRRSVRKYRSGSGDGFIFRFMPAQCAPCPLLQQCRGQPHPPTTHRDVFISDYYLCYARLVAYSQTDEFKQDMKLRPHIERIIAILVLYYGARYARFRGQQKVDFQLKMCATAFNLKHWLQLRGKEKRKKRRRFGAPAPSQGVLRLAAA